MANPHVVTQIRDAIVSQLTIAGVAGGRVFLYKSRPRDVSLVPFVYVKTGDVSSDVASLGYPSWLARDTDYELGVVVMESDDYEAAAFAILRDLELALFGTVAAKTLGGKVHELQAGRASPDQDDAIGAKPTYAIRLVVTARIRHAENTPDVLAQ